jgi:hypothetical protein
MVGSPRVLTTSYEEMQSDQWVIVSNSENVTIVFVWIFRQLSNLAMPKGKAGSLSKTIHRDSEPQALKSHNNSSLPAQTGLKRLFEFLSMV